MEKNSQIKTRQMPFMKQIAKFSSRQYFLLYGILAESTTIADNSPGKNYHQTHLSGREHVMGHGLIMFIVSR